MKYWNTSLRTSVQLQLLILEFLAFDAIHWSLYTPFLTLNDVVLQR